jgi:hypothetical protein
LNSDIGDQIRAGSDEAEGFIREHPIEINRSNATRANKKRGVIIAVSPRAEPSL